MFSVGDYIIYFNKYGEQCPGKVVAIHTVWPRVQIEVNHPEGDRVVWVKPSNLKHQ